MVNHEWESQVTGVADLTRRNPDVFYEAGIADYQFAQFTSTELTMKRPSPS
jgi:hypothetical protein